ncbi:MAG: DUF1801 domain-containing protein [Chloroflexi bacterium]|nr:DUF1801 domain-containing protein [Chloroflexota bacterium]MCC6891417.1 DUF1801 domain-containing protein [Anaerolineae bacterium]
MDSEKSGFQSIDEYIASFPKPIQELLQRVRETVKAAAPRATEKISYQMPTFDLHGNLVHFAAAKGHIGFYPTPSAISAFQDELTRYKGAKGSVQFPFDQPLPLDLITRMVKFRVEENEAKAAAKSKKKK